VGQQATRTRRGRPGGGRGVEHVDVDGDEDGVRAVRRGRQRALDGRVDALPVNLAGGDDFAADLPDPVDVRLRVVPAGQPQFDEVLAGELPGIVLQQPAERRPRRQFAAVRVADVVVGVDVDHANGPVDRVHQRLSGRVRQRVVAPDRDREDPPLGDLGQHPLDAVVRR